MVSCKAVQKDIAMADEMVRYTVFSRVEYSDVGMVNKMVISMA